jgi:hypothetical protein
MEQIEIMQEIGRRREREILDEMYDFEEEFDLQEKEDGQYFIGIYICMKDVQMLNSGENSNKLYLGMAISANLFFHYEYKYVRRYLCSAIQYCPDARNYRLKISIMQLNITPDGLCLVTVKTYWLKLIQRHWKKIMRKRKEIMERMKIGSYLRQRELGKNKKERIEKIEGMLSIYSKKKG